jgi:hypothetical protein
MTPDIKELLLKLTLQDIFELLREKNNLEPKNINPNVRRTLGKVEVYIRSVPFSPESKHIAEYELVLPGNHVLMRIDSNLSNNVDKCIKELNDVIHKYQK